MANNRRPIQFREYLPEVFQADEVNGVSFLSRFLQAFETVFEEHEAAIEGVPGGVLQLTIQSGSGTTVTVAPFNSGPVEFPIGTPVTVAHKILRTTLSQPIPANGVNLTQIEVQETSFVAAIETNDLLSVHPGGIPDLFNSDTTPPPQFAHRPQPNFDYLSYLANWVALPLRAEKSVDWNRQFFLAAISLYPERGTPPGMEALLRAWLRGDLLEGAEPILTDLTRAHTDVDAVFQLGETATLGVDTVLGEGTPFFFITDLITNPAVSELRQPVGLDIFQRAVRFLLDTEKPVHTYYQLRVRAHTMQFAPPPGGEIEGETYAQVGETTLLWDEPWVFNSDC